MPFRASATGPFRAPGTNPGSGGTAGQPSNQAGGRVPMSAIIADDEPLAREELRFLLDEIGDVEVVGTAANGLEALELIEKLDPALAFLDIQMPGLDGLGVARRLRENQMEPPHIIFSTAFDQFAVEAFRLEAMDYLLKPVDRERLAATLARARRAVADRLTESAAPVAS